MDLRLAVTLLGGAVPGRARAGAVPARDEGEAAAGVRIRTAPYGFEPIPRPLQIGEPHDHDSRPGRPGFDPRPADPLRPALPARAAVRVGRRPRRRDGVGGRAPRRPARAGRRHGAVLFRGFPLATAEDFDAFVAAFDLPNFPYDESLSNAVRVNKTPRVFTANEAPPSGDDLPAPRDGPDAGLPEPAVLLLRAAGRDGRGDADLPVGRAVGAAGASGARSSPATARRRGCGTRT